MYDPVDEILDRVKRIETRVTIMGRHVGADVGGGKPIWDHGKIEIPTRNCSVNELMKVVPNGWTRPVPVSMNGDYLFSFTV